MNYTELNLEEFGNREIDSIAELLTAYSNSNVQPPIKIGFNLNSGNVFIIDGDDKVFMVNSNGDLEEFISCFECRNEGLESEFEPDMDCSGCCEIAGIEFEEEDQ